MARECEECGAEYDIQDSKDALEEEYDGEVDWDEEYECLCPECTLLRVHNYGVLGSSINSDWY